MGYLMNVIVTGCAGFIGSNLVDIPVIFQSA